MRSMVVVKFVFLKQLIGIIGLLPKIEGVVFVCNHRERSVYCDIMEDLDTDDIRFVICPLEAEGEDRIGSCEMNYTTGQYYCYNCKRYGRIADLDKLLQDKLLL